MSIRIETRPGQENLSSATALTRGTLLERGFDRAIGFLSQTHQRVEGGARIGLAIVAATGAAAAAFFGIGVPDTSAILQAWNAGKNQAKSGKFEDPSRGNTENAASAQQTAGIALKEGYKLESRVHLPATRPGESNQTPGTATPRPDVSPTPTRTPEPTPTRTPTPETTYSQWPSKIVDAMNRVYVIDNVRLVRSEAVPDPLCSSACYYQGKREVWVINPPPPDAAPEDVNIAHELGHSYQERIKEEQKKNTWQETTQYQEFISTLNEFNSWLKSQGYQEWTQEPYELFANIYAGYMLGDPQFQNPPSDWNKWVPNPYQFPQLKAHYDKWVRR